MNREHVPGSPRRVLGIDLGGASSRTTGYVLLAGSDRPTILDAGTPPKAKDARHGEDLLLGVLDKARPDVVTIDAPLTLPPCLTCPSYCRGPGELCELKAAQEMWAAGWNAVSARACEKVVYERTGERPLPTMQLGVITSRAVALARKLATRGTVPAVLERGEVLEVYPRATLRRLGEADMRLLPKANKEPEPTYRDRVLRAFSDLIDGVEDCRDELENPHVFDALAAAYTGWLAPDGLEQPPPGFNVSTGWIWFPAAAAPES